MDVTLFKKYWWLLGFLGFIILAFFLTIYLLGKNQNLIPRASTSTGAVELSISPASGNYNVGDTIPVNILMNTNGVAIGQFGLWLSYPASGTTPEVSAANLKFNQTMQNSGDWGCQYQTITPTGTAVEIKISCANVTTAGFTNNSPESIVSFDLNVDQTPATNPVVLSFNATETKVVDKSDGLDVLKTPSGTATFTVGNVSSNHKICINRTCALSSGSGTDQCQTVGAECTPSFSQEAVTGCSGKYDPNCYNCVIDSPGPQEINILDFSCFRSAFGHQRSSGGIDWN